MTCRLVAVRWVGLLILGCLSVTDCAVIDQIDMVRDHEMLMVVNGLGEFRTRTDLRVQMGESIVTPIRSLYQGNTSRIYFPVSGEMEKAVSLSVTNLKSGSVAATDWIHLQQSPVVSSISALSGPTSGTDEIVVALHSWPLLKNTNATGCSVMFGEIAGSVSVKNSSLFQTWLTIIPPPAHIAGLVAVEILYSFGLAANTEAKMHQVAVSFDYLFTDPSMPLILPSATPSTSTVGIIPFTFAVQDFVDHIGTSSVSIKFGDLARLVVSANTVELNQSRVTWITVTPPHLPEASQLYARNGEVRVPVTVTAPQINAEKKTISLFFSYLLPLFVHDVAFVGGRYMLLLVTYSVETEGSSPGQSFDCSRYLSASTIKLIGGQSAECAWKSGRSFTIKIGNHAEIKPGMKMYFRGGVAKPKDNSSLTQTMLSMPGTDVIVNDDPDFYIPVAAINGPSKFGADEYQVTLSAWNSFGRKLVYNWSCIGTDLDAILQGHKQHQPQLTVLTNKLSFDTTYPVGLIVTDFLGRSSLPATRTLLRSKSTGVPLLQIDGPTEIWVDVASSLNLHVQNIAELSPNPIQFEWEAGFDGDQHTLGTGPVLHVPANTFAPDQEYSIGVTGHIAGQESSTYGSAHVTLHTTSPKLRMCIDGGTKQTVSTRRAFKLTPLLSHNVPDLRYRWYCASEGGAECATNNGSSLHIPPVEFPHFPPDAFSEGIYTFSVTAFKEGDMFMSHANQIVQFTSDYLADVFPAITWVQPQVASHCGRINKGNTLVLSTSRQDKDCQWSVTDNDGNIVAIPSRATSINGNTLTLATKHIPGFLPGKIYSFHTKNSSSVTITLNQPPVGGGCTLSPQSGASVHTQFTIACSNWHDEDQLDAGYQFLRYTFRYRSLAHGNTADWTTLKVASQQPILRNFLLPASVPVHDKVEVQVVISDDESGETKWTTWASIRDINTEESTPLGSEAFATDSSYLNPGGPLQTAVHKGFVGQALSIMSHSAELGRLHQRTSRRLLSVSQATAILDYVVKVRTSLGDALSVSAGTVSQVLGTLAVVAKLSSQLTVSPYQSSDLTKALDVLNDCALVFEKERLEMSDKIARDMWTTVAWLTSADVLSRVDTADTTSGKIELHWVQDKLSTVHNTVRNVIRRWKLVNKLPDESAYIMDAESMETGSARLIVRKMQKALLTGCVSSFGGTSCNGLSTYPLLFKFPEEISSIVPNTIDTAAWTLPAPFTQSGKTFFGYMFGAAVADPNSTSPMLLTGLSDKISITITVPEFGNKSSLPEGYAECKYWKATSGYWDQDGVTNKEWAYAGHSDGYPDHGPNVTCFTSHLNEFALENIDASLRPTPAPPTQAPTPAPTAAPTLVVTNTPPYWTMGLDSNEHRLSITFIRSPLRQRQITLFDESDSNLPLDSQIKILLDGTTRFSTIFVSAELIREGGPTDADVISINYRAIIIGAGVTGSDLGLNITYEVTLAHAGVKFRATEALDLEDPGFPCLARKLFVKPAAPGHNLAAGKTLIFSLPKLETQVVFKAFSNASETTNAKEVLTPNEGMYIPRINPWSEYGGSELQAWCDVTKPTSDLLAVCHINPSTRYGCPFRHPTADPRTFSAQNPVMTDNEKCKYASALHREKLCSLGYSQVTEYTVYNSEATGGTQMFDSSGGKI